MVAAIKFNVPKYYFVVKFLVSYMRSHEVPLIQRNPSVTCRFNQVDFVLVVLELEDHRDMVEVALCVSPGQDARRRVGLEQKEVTRVGAFYELGLRNLVELPRLLLGVRTLAVLVALAVFDVAGEFFFPSLGQLRRFGLEFEDSVLHAHDLDFELLRLIRVAVDAVHEMVKVENPERRLHVLGRVALVVLEFAILEHEVAVLPPRKPRGTLLLEVPDFVLGQPLCDELLLKFGGQYVVDGGETQVGHLAAQVVRIEVVDLLIQLGSSQGRGTHFNFLSIRIEWHVAFLLIFLLLDFSVPIEENGFERSDLVLFLFELGVCSPLGVGLVVGRDGELGVRLADGVALARIVVLLVEDPLLIEFLGVEVGVVVVQVGVLLLFRGRRVIEPRERHIRIMVQLDFVSLIRVII